MQATSGIGRPAGGSRLTKGVWLAGRVAWRGLARVLSGSDPPPVWWRRSPWQRRIVWAALGAVALLLGTASVVSPVSTAGTADGAGPPAGFGARSFSSGSSQMSCRTFSSATYCHGGTHSTSSLPVLLWLLLSLAVVVIPMTLVLRCPLLSWRIGWLGLLLVPLLRLRWDGGLPWDPVQILVLLVVLCAAGTLHGRPVLYWLCALTLAPWWFWAIRDGLGVITAALGSVAFGAIAAAIDGVTSRRRAQQTLADQAEQTELERARRAVLEERARIARELHDVVAHHMSLMAIRAESAPHRLGVLPDPVSAEFGALSGSAREALADMRRLLGVLRSDQPAARTPQPGLPDLPALIDTARQAGMKVELSPHPAPDQVPPSTSVCAYRIIQEALSNAGQHAAGAPVSVSVHHDVETVTLHVANGPQAPARPPGNGHRPGHGLAGMRERAELLGGSLSAGPAPDGGFVVSAVLPLSGATA
jgi:signal transduction histidine kinase